VEAGWKAGLHVPFRRGSGPDDPPFDDRVDR
jgi:hypothetical protein